MRWSAAACWSKNSASEEGHAGSDGGAAGAGTASKAKKEKEKEISRNPNLLPQKSLCCLRSLSEISAHVRKRDESETEAQNLRVIKWLWRTQAQIPKQAGRAINYTCQQQVALVLTALLLQEGLGQYGSLRCCYWTGMQCRRHRQ